MVSRAPAQRSRRARGVFFRPGKALRRMSLAVSGPRSSCRRRSRESNRRAAAPFCRGVPAAPHAGSRHSSMGSILTDSRFPIPDSRFPILDSRFPISDSRLPVRRPGRRILPRARRRGLRRRKNRRGRRAWQDSGIERGLVASRAPFESNETAPRLWSRGLSRPRILRLESP